MKQDSAPGIFQSIFGDFWGFYWFVVHCEPLCVTKPYFSSVHKPMLHICELRVEMVQYIMLVSISIYIVLLVKICYLVACDVLCRSFASAIWLGGTYSADMHTTSGKSKIFLITLTAFFPLKSILRGKKLFKSDKYVTEVKWILKGKKLSSLIGQR